MTTSKKYLLSIIVLLFTLPLAITAQEIKLKSFNSAPELSSLTYYNNKYYAPYERAAKIAIIEGDSITGTIDYKFDENPKKDIEIEGVANIGNLFLLLDEANASIYVLDISLKKKKTITKNLKLKKSDQKSNYGLEGIAVDTANKQFYLIRENIKGKNKQSMIYRYDYELNKAKNGLDSFKLLDSVIVQFPDTLRVSDLHFENSKLYCLVSNKAKKKYAIFSLETKEGGGLKNVVDGLVEPKLEQDFSTTNVGNKNYEGLTMDKEGFAFIADEGSRKNSTSFLKTQPMNLAPNIFSEAPLVTMKPTINLFLCDPESLSEAKEDDCCNIGVNCCRTIPSKFDFIFESPCYPKKGKQNAITAKYITIYDERDGTISYLKLRKSVNKGAPKCKKCTKKEKGSSNSETKKKKEMLCSKDTCKSAFEYVEVMKQIIPIANREMLVIIISKDDNFTVEANGEQYFLEYQDGFKKNLETLANKEKERTAKDNKANFEGPTEREQEITQLEKLKALNQATALLNGRHAGVDVFQDQYHADLMCLRYRIMSEFNIPNFVNDSIQIDSLVAEAKLLRLELSKIDSTKNGLLVIKSIEKSYLNLISKQINRFKVFYNQVRIPDQDVFKLEVTQVDKKKNVFNRSFRTRGGFKIDFSTGIFLTGLSVPEYVVQKHSFKYKPATFGLDSLGNIDTTYASRLRDTSGHRIHVKDPIANYGVGLLAHAYVRTGTFINIGISTGILVNNIGVQILIGGSTMFNIKKTRLSLTGGVVIGQKKTISPTAKPYLQSDNPDADGTVYDLPTDVPAFFEPTDVPTFVKWKCSWFFGLTYNFGSVSVPIPAQN